MAYLVHPPHPLEGRVISTIKCGAEGNFVEANTVVQSCLLCGDHNFHPDGQEFFIVDLDVFMPFVTLTSLPAEYIPFKTTGATRQLASLPSRQYVPFAASWRGQITRGM